MRPSTALFLIRLGHTIAWALFAGCILALPIAAFARRFEQAAWLITAVMLEITVLAFNRWACPLTAVAARYTSARQPNFDIFLPLWLARYNKQIFGPLFALGLVYTGLQWWRHTGGA